MTDYTSLERDARARIDSAADLAAVEALRVEFLGKQGSISALLKTLGAMGADERLEKGPQIQGLRQAVSDAPSALEQRCPAGCRSSVAPCVASELH